MVHLGRGMLSLQTTAPQGLKLKYQCQKDVSSPLQMLTPVDYQYHMKNHERLKMEQVNHMTK
jgi:hypothetical protein